MSQTLNTGIGTNRKKRKIMDAANVKQLKITGAQSRVVMGKYVNS